MENYNIGYHCTTRQCELGLADKVAFKWVDKNNNLTNYSFEQLDSQSSQFANVLEFLNVKSGDVIFTFLPKSPEQFFVFLGALKKECIVGTLFSSFGNDALCDRLIDSCAKVIITNKAHYNKLKSILGELVAVHYVIVTDLDEDISEMVLSYKRLMAGKSKTFPIYVTQPETPSVLHYTSGSTGKPKGVLHCHRSVLHQSYTSEKILGLNDDDIFWCTADQGWVTGTSYGIIGPWVLGVTQLHYGGGYNAASWMSLLGEHKVTVWYTAPTALRMLLREDDSLYDNLSLPCLRSIFSVGEPLNPEVITWAQFTLGKNVYDTWFQTETGAIMIANMPGQTICPGSMGRPVDGVNVKILDLNGEQVESGEKGHLCIKAGWASMFISYLNNNNGYSEKFKNGWYYTGDMAWEDSNGYVWFIGRDDDVINTSGHLISPFEIESCILELPEVCESAVIGAPDAILYEKIIAFVHLREANVFDSSYELKIKRFIAKNLSSVAIPQEVIFIKNIPKNKSGKIMRRYLRSKYLGLEHGDLSTIDIE